MGHCAGLALSPVTVSVLLPVRDGAATLENALRSIAWQTLQDWEAVVVDDGSQDATAAVLKAWASRDERIKVHRQSPRGLVAALNRGLSLCSGRYVARMDADDISHPRRLAEQVKLLEQRPDLTGASCLVRLFPSRELGLGFRRYQRWLNTLVEADDIERELLVESPLVHPSVILRRSALEAVGGYRDRGWPEDYDLWLRLHEAGGSFAKVRQVLFFWRDHAQRMTRTHPAYASEQLRRLKVDFLIRRHLPGKRGVVIWGAGRNGKRLARELRQAGGRLLAFADLHPRRIGETIEGVPVVLPQNAPLEPGLLHLAAVGREGGREEVRRDLTGRGLREMHDFLCLA